MQMKRAILGGVFLCSAIALAAPAVAQYPSMFPYVDAPARNDPAPNQPAQNQPTRNLGDPVALARNNLNSAEARVQQLNQQLGRDKEQMTTVRSRVSAGDAALSELNKDLDSAAREASERRAAFDQAAARYHAARGALDQAMTDAGRPISVTQQSRTAADAVSAAKDEVHLAESAATQRMA